MGTKFDFTHIKCTCIYFVSCVTLTCMNTVTALTREAIEIFQLCILRTYKP